jgi:hypothetical protein
MPSGLRTRSLSGPVFTKVGAIVDVGSAKELDAGSAKDIVLPIAMKPEIREAAKERRRDRPFPRNNMQVTHFYVRSCNAGFRCGTDAISCESASPLLPDISATYLTDGCDSGVGSL